ncbi:helix-turn-helix domain-containing protein [Paenalcaligenes faecalis]|uniref:helix-turn-helix domain-containing protein n=1 Tax=Paenalcaligenes faecalis TaxID=2980099 RepID=UPI0022B9A049|nr:helix-turn-helix domain-containing protein [Paenalcaligenes faecalis]
MSENKQLSWSWSHLLSASILTQRFAQLSLKASKVYIVLKVRCNLKTGIAFPSLRRISVDAGISVSSVQRALKELENAGYLESFKDRRSKKYVLYEILETEKGKAVRKQYIPSDFKILVQEAREEFEAQRLKAVETVKPIVSAPYFENILSDCDLEKLPADVVEALQRIKESIDRKKP